MVGLGSSAVLHFINIVMHVLNGILVFLLVRQFVKEKWACFIGALLFLVHPLQVESVAWVSEFRGLLSSFFCFTALYFYVKYCHSIYGGSPSLKNKNGIFSFVLFGLGLLAKPSAIVMPVIAIGMEYFLFKPSLKKIFQNVAAFFIPVVVFVLLTVTVQSNAPTSPIWARPLIWMDAISFYLYKLVAPISLVASYDRTPATVIEKGWLFYTWIIPVGIGVYLWKIKQKWPIIILSFCIFIVGFLPVSGLVPFTFQLWSTVADRYMYLPMLGVALGFAFLATKLNSKWQTLSLISILICFSLISGFIQVKVWKNDLALWTHCIDKNPNGARAYVIRGKKYLKHQEFQKAIDDFNLAMEIQPLSTAVYINRAKAYMEIKKYDKALADYNIAISLKPKNAEFYVNRSAIHLLLKNYLKSLDDSNKALLFDPQNAKAYNNRNAAYFYMKKYGEALKDAKKAKELGFKVEDKYIRQLEKIVEANR